MRLLEPLNGVKMAQGHYLTHLVLFLGMLTIETQPHLDLIDRLVKIEYDAAHPEIKRFDPDEIKITSLVDRLAHSE